MYDLILGQWRKHGDVIGNHVTSFTSANGLVAWLSDGAKTVEYATYDPEKGGWMRDGDIVGTLVESLQVNDAFVAWLSHSRQTVE